MTNNHRYRIRILQGLFILIYIFPCTDSLSAQGTGTHHLSMDEAITMALATNPAARNAELNVRMSALKQRQSLLSDPLQISYAYGNGTAGMQNEVLEINQQFNFPLTVIKQARFNKESMHLTQSEQALITGKLIAETKAAYTRWVYQLVKMRLISRTADLVNLFIDSTGLPMGKSDTAILPRLSLETQYAALQNQHFQAEQDYKIATHHMEQVLFSTDPITPADTTLELYALQSSHPGSDKFNPTRTIQFYQQRADLQTSGLEVEKSKFYPTFQLGYYHWAIGGDYHFQGIKIGLTVPLWYFPQREKVKEARIKADMAINDVHDQEFTLGRTVDNLKLQLDQLFVFISFYRENALKLVDLQDETAIKAMTESQTSYQQFLDQISKSLATKIDYLQKLQDYNLTAIQLEYYIH